jgi:hypothetical protein
MLHMPRAALKKARRNGFRRATVHAARYEIAMMVIAISHSLFLRPVPSGKVHDSLKLGCHGEGFDAMAVAIAASRPALTTPGELYRPM